ncbi:esterase/lipase family protein [Paludisphaera soli]|uniref:esterase/lipase family protein n=1 Tax=Paludisphaera soli TaxID=2712865 RepID=UPI0013EA0E11|nr:alpha/beta hydrolase [Paludisphaera soli]
MEETRRAGLPRPRLRLALVATLLLAAPCAAGAAGIDPEAALARAASARRLATRAERVGSRECVDRYYEGAVFAFAAMTADPDPDSRRCGRAVALYNQNLADCLRSATCHRALDPRSRLLVRSPRGVIVVPIVHRGFVWSPADFHQLLDPAAAPRNPSNQRRHAREGVGATQVVRRQNPHATADDAFLPEPMFFPATAVLRPDLDAWCGGAGGPGDVLEFHDPLRVSQVAPTGASWTLASDLDAPIAYLEEATGGLQSGWSGLLNPSQDVDRAFLGMLEPYQPGKIPLIFVHGLYDTPYTFTDLMNSLRSIPGFLDRYQIIGYRYATGLTFLHSAALFRRDLHRFEAAFDPSRSDPGLQNTVLLGHSMGGLLIKLQIVSSGRALWNLVANRPLESLALAEAARAFLADLFFFEPVPFVRRVVFLATPHDGLGVAAQPGGVISERLTRRPEDLRALVPQVERDNPGAIKPYMYGLPNSIGMLRRREPVHQVMRCLPVNPNVRLHTIAGTAKVPAAVAHGDGAVPIASAHHPGAESETLVPEFHTTMNSSDFTLVEVDRILRRHVATAPVSGR